MDNTPTSSKPIKASALELLGMYLCKLSEMSTGILLGLLFITASYAAEVVNVAPGIFSKKVVSDGLKLPASSTFSSINTLTTTVHLDKPYSVFVHYQFTLFTDNQDFYSKLLVNDRNAGSLIHSGKQQHKNPIGLWMANLNAGYYTFEIHYKSPAAINVGANADWQTAVLQVMWFEDARVVSDGIKCYPTSTATNNYNNWGPINDLQVTLQLPNDRAILSAYQLSTQISSPSHLVTALDVNGFYQQSTPCIKGDSSFLALQGAYAGQYKKGIHYFNVLYRSPTTFSFTDCQYDYKENKNLYAMMLPPSCKVITVNPRTKLTLTSTNLWSKSDLQYSLVLTKLSHVIIMYQLTGYSPHSNFHIVSHIKIGTAIEKHTVSHSGYEKYYGNFGLWQGSLNSGTHSITVEYRNYRTAKNEALDWHTRALTVVYC